MAICLIYENPDQTQEQAEQVIGYLRSQGQVPPDGARLVFGGAAEPGWRMISIWESEEALERFFAEHMTAAFDEAGIALENVKRTTFEVYKLIAGDLTGVPAPA